MGRRSTRRPESIMRSLPQIDAPSGPRRRLVVARFSIALAALVAPSTVVAASPGAPAVALPDTGLFSSVAAQLREDRASLAALTPGTTPNRLWLLIETGQADEAARL